MWEGVREWEEEVGRRKWERGCGKEDVGRRKPSDRKLASEGRKRHPF